MAFGDGDAQVIIIATHGEAGAYCHHAAVVGLDDERPLRLRSDLEEGLALCQVQLAISVGIDDVYVAVAAQQQDRTVGKLDLPRLAQGGRVVGALDAAELPPAGEDRKSTRLNSSH